MDQFFRYDLLKKNRPFQNDLKVNCYCRGTYVIFYVLYICIKYSGKYQMAYIKYFIDYTEKKVVYGHMTNQICY